MNHNRCRPHSEMKYKASSAISSDAANDYTCKRVKIQTLGFNYIEARFLQDLMQNKETLTISLHLYLSRYQHEEQKVKLRFSIPQPIRIALWSKCLKKLQNAQVDIQISLGKRCSIQLPAILQRSSCFHS